MRETYRNAIRLLSEVENIQATLASLRRKMRRTKLKIFSESAIMKSGEASSSAEQISENLVDIVGGEEHKASAGSSEVPLTGQSEILSLENFLKRPVPLASYDVAVGAASGVVIPVWDNYTRDPAVRAKLRNYAYLKADLHVRVAISGSPFHYGRMLASYQPYPERNENIQSHLNNLALDSDWRPLFLNYLSQAPGAATIDIKSNEPLEIVCPFISTKPMHRLFNSGATAIGSGTSFDDLADCGSLYMYSLNNVESVSSGTSSSVAVFVYGWLENVELGTSTATQVAILTESKVAKASRGKKGKKSKPKDVPDHEDERKKGPVERISSSVASFTSHLTTVPYIGPIATATTMAAETLSKVSAIFGWSKPVLIDTPCIVKNQPYQNGALTIGTDTNYRIVLDPKQELTVDPRVCGSELDEMNIGYMASIPSYFDTFAWSPTDTSLDFPIWQTIVNPNVHTTRVNGGLTYMQPTAMAMATDVFAFWRGTITYRFEIVCSAYHRGKLAFYFDPNWGQSDLINNNLSLNKQFFKIVDIQETQLVEFTVQWAYPRAWSKVCPYPQSLGLINPSVISPTYVEYGNGFVGVTPFTTLQSPDDSSISINCYAFSDDMQVNYLTDENVDSRSRQIITESKLYDPDDITSMDLNESSSNTDDICLYHFGEQPVSFRGLLRRYMSDGNMEETAQTGDNIYYRLFAPIVPDISTPYGTASSPHSLSLFGYLRYAYLGLRGGIRKRLKPVSLNVTSATTNAVVHLRATGSSGASVFVAASGAYTAGADMKGTVTFAPISNGGIEFECPMYTNNLFLFSFADDLVGSNAVQDMETFWVRRYEAYLVGDGDQPVVRLYIESAAAEDFSFMRYQGAPYYVYT